MPKIIVINMIDNNSSFTMAVRLKQLREEKGLSHDKLSKALFSHYGVKVSSDSLCNYEVASKDHSKAYKNQGMRVEYLRCLADFYGVSCDYLLGADVPRSPDTTVQEIVKFTGLSEENVSDLITWNSISSPDDSANWENPTPSQRRVLNGCIFDYVMFHRKDNMLSLINDLISLTISRSEELCYELNGIMLDKASKIRAGDFWESYGDIIPDEMEMKLLQGGYAIIRRDERAELRWKRVLRIIRNALSDRIDRQVALRSKVDE